MREARGPVLYAALEKGKNVGKRLLLIAAVIVLILAILMRMSWLPASGSVSDFMGGAAVGLWLGVLLNWVIDRP